MSERGPEPPERDPLADLVARSIGTRIEAVASDDLGAEIGIERKRLRFTTKDGAASLIFERGPVGAALEAQLLPFLARRTDRVPVVHARGIPPPHASLGPWLLLEDVLGAPSACDGDPEEIVRAKLAIEHAVAKDGAALRALGVGEDARELPAPLARIPRALVHGDLRCDSARRTARGVVISGWSRATLGCPVLDAAFLELDLERAGRADAARHVRAAYAEASGLADASALLAAAKDYLATASQR